jgi:kinesin family protein 11
MSENSITVVVRVRPDSDNDSQPNNRISVDESKHLLSLPRDKKGISDFKFSGVLGPQSSQEQLYNHCKSVINDVSQGISSCIMAYGQTGSGKTFSMYGKGWEEDAQSLSKSQKLNTTLENNGTAEIEVVMDDNSKSEENISIDGNNELQNNVEDKVIIEKPNPPFVIEKQSTTEDEFGVIPRSISDLFEKLDSEALDSEQYDFTVNCSIMQIYNEKIFDLLQDKRRENPLQIRESGRSAAGTYNTNTVTVQGLSLYRVYSKEEVISLLKGGLRNRATRATEFNQESSRSHTILQLSIQVEQADVDGLMVIKRSTLSLVDLAGKNLSNYLSIYLSNSLFM